MITGASRGIGRAIAGRLADEGWDLLLSARGGQGLDEAVASLSDSGAAVRGVPADMGRPADIEALAAAQYERGSELDLLVLAAGVGAGGLIDGYRMHRLDLQFAVNVRSNGVLATAFAPGYVDTDMAAWVHESIPPAQMMKTSDIAELTLALTRLSRWAAVPSIVMTRPGPNLHRA
jgi:short-subunit dehydrogenase